jgi:hypothetical protein
MTAPTPSGRGRSYHRKYQGKYDFTDEIDEKKDGKFVLEGTRQVHVPAIRPMDEAGASYISVGY